MDERRGTDAAGGVLVAATMILVAIREWGGGAVFSYASMATSVAALVLLSLNVRWSRRAFLVIGAALSAIAVATLPDWPGAIARALGGAAFIIAFFTALTSLRSAAISSKPVSDAGRFLADQPPGRRYLALTLGGALFGLILLYGAITLLGSLSRQSAQDEANPEITRIRLRRMMVAIQRGFIATLPWSPLTFAMAISTSLVPGSSWAAAVLPSLVSGLLLAGIGWALDTALKPRITGPRPVRRAPEGRWGRKLAPLLMLLAVLGALITGIHIATGVGVVGVVMVVVPLLSLLWMVEQDVLGHRRGVIGHVAERARDFATVEMAGLRAEVVLLAMAGFIGSLGSSLTAPLIADRGIDLAGISPYFLLLGIFWIIPITGQFGMNPILSASLIVPLLPLPAEMGVAPSAVILAITSGWALSGATSPYTASVMMVGQYGGVSALHAGLRWNGLYALICGIVLSGWIALAATIL
ncbi:hypothetical protein [Palleronia sp. LCG004]|uniref:hypothetical protein n=1 Tax=Palleronia sp. LCG004 TaxID=3079304 RepID=UPI002941F3F1|nr:hypothetical protein [Palleronia sp. LCG004]WOI55216.1 hypothetical protein RVY76_09110 [Palleronia sp. LCG004]